MGLEKPHKPVKLVIPVLYSEREILDKMIPLLIKEYGPLDYPAEAFPFTFTNYYDDEMEGRTYRIFLSFEKLITPEKLVDVKIFTNQMELEFAVDGKRKVNLDPGYIQLGKFVLATTKDQQHRLFIRDGIFEEITLFYRDKKWQDHVWTYPDYRSDQYKSILIDIRSIYKKQLDKI